MKTFCLFLLLLSIWSGLIDRCVAQGGGPPPLKASSASGYEDVIRDLKCPEEECPNVDAVCDSGVALCRFGEILALNISGATLGDGALLTSSIGQLTRLNSLILRSTTVGGSVPFASLVRLSYLDLRANRLSGTLDGLEKLTDLRIAVLADNLFEASIPSLQPLTYLRAIYLFGNKLVSPTIDLPPRVVNSPRLCIVQARDDANCIGSCPASCCAKNCTLIATTMSTKTTASATTTTTTTTTPQVSSASSTTSTAPLSLASSELTSTLAEKNQTKTRHRDTKTSKIKMSKTPPVVLTPVDMNDTNDTSPIIYFVVGVAIVIVFGLALFCLVSALRRGRRKGDNNNDADDYGDVGMQEVPVQVAFVTDSSLDDPKYGLVPPVARSSNAHRGYTAAPPLNHEYTSVPELLHEYDSVPPEAVVNGTISSVASIPMSDKTNSSSSGYAALALVDGDTMDAEDQS
eukprot:TRINITY_DN868_c0_g2_i2.p1 TRINITY_DN868_c0_g2~~TRINITY_DN868_c0_g2_i2.p1  ORF type:complete len:474 (-),score=31.65 TRINITY_DN868_c0_g2_i2:51-1430(-)